MKKLGVLTMLLGVLSTASSTYFAVTNQPDDAMPMVLFWGLLSACEFLSAWIWLFSKHPLIQPSQKLTLIALFVMALVWIIFISSHPDAKSIFVWALRTLNYSGLYFLGLIIYYRASLD